MEAELDIEYIKSVAPEVPLTVVYNAQYSLLSWCQQITGLDNAPLIHSVSYGNDEAQQSSTAYMFTSNTAFMIWSCSCPSARGGSYSSSSIPAPRQRLPPRHRGGGWPQDSRVFKYFAVGSAANGLAFTGTPSTS